MLGLPNSTTMAPRSFGIIEEHIGPVMRQFADDIVAKNLVEEVRQCHGDMKDDNDESLFNLWQQKKLPDGCHDLWPKMPGTHDMGWQGRASGLQHNSMTGDACFFGGKTRKPIAHVVVSKGCSFCMGWKKRANKTVAMPEHDCRKNWDGSSGAMEPHGCLVMFKRLCSDSKVVVESIVTDDDSSIKSKMKWCNKDHMTMHGLTDPPTIINSNGNEVVRPDHGELPINMPEPTFFADPNHRKKTWKKTLYQMLHSTKKSNMTIAHMDVLRLGTNFAHMVRTLHGKTDEAMLTASKAVIEHHFDCHTHCGDWCKRKDQTDEEREEKKKCYRSKEKDATSHKELLKRIERFVTLESLHEVAHQCDTLCNESFNNIAAWLAPKNKVHGTTESLKNRVAVAVGITSLGTEEHFTELFRRLGVTMTPVVEHCIHLQSKCRSNRNAKSKTAEGKKKRVDNYHKKLLEKTATAKREKAKREGTYSTGMGINGGYTEDELAKAKQMHPREFHQAERRAAKERGATKCPFCQRSGHMTRRSKNCGEHQLWLDKIAKKKDNNTAIETGAHDVDDTTEDAVHIGNDTPAAQTARDASECELLDSMGFDDGNDEFFDCCECLDDDDCQDTSSYDKEN